MSFYTLRALGDLLGKLAPHMELFVPSTWAENVVSLKDHMERDIAIMALAPEFDCDVKKYKEDEAGKSGHLFIKN